MVKDGKVKKSYDNDGYDDDYDDDNWWILENDSQKKAPLFSFF